jgi:4-hydroxy-tetrahydrodipicolinate synthase
MSIFTGSAVAVATPFKNGKVDFDAYGKMIEWQIAEGTDAIVSCGTTGEASTMTDSEQIDTVACAVDVVKGRVPVIAGAGSNDTNHGISLSKELEKTGIDAFLHVTPYYNKCTQKGLIMHMNAIADSIDLPMLLYSVPGRTGVNITPKTCAELANHPNIVGIKEASGDIAQCVEICRLVPDGFDVYSGNDDMVVPLLSIGGKGVISVVANVAPRDTHDMVKKFLDGDVAGAYKLQFALKPLIDAMFIEVNPIPVKAALSLLGIYGPEMRLPLCEPSDASLAVIERELKAYGLL